MCRFHPAVQLVLAAVDEEEVLVNAILYLLAVLINVNAQLWFDCELLRLRVKLVDLLHAPYKFLL